MPTTHILFDFFGTLVDYDASRGTKSYPRTVAALSSLGAALTEEEFHTRWMANWMDFELRSHDDHREFSMTEVGNGFLTGVLGRAPGPDEIELMIPPYLQEWNDGVYHIDGMAAWLTELAQRYRLAIVSNTHEPDLVAGHLARMGVAGLFDPVVLSIEVGWRKPHPEIYAITLEKLRITPQEAVFVGDNYLADFVGPTRAGIPAYLIDPAGVTEVPAERRLGSVFEVAERIVG